MNKEFIPYEEAVALKELGFDEKCFGRYVNTDPNHPRFEYNGSPMDSTLIVSKKWVLAPLYQQAFRWFREEYNLKSFFVPVSNSATYCINGNPGYQQNQGSHKNWREAELACLKKLIEIVKDETQNDM